MRTFLNPLVRRNEEFRGMFTADEYRDVDVYFAAHPELQATPLRALPSLAGALGLAGVDAKDETGRFGVNAFKIVGVGYAVERLGDEAARKGLVCATAGNHGRAVARVAQQKRVPCTIFLPALRTARPIEVRTRASRVAAMREDGAEVIDVAGTYEEAVARAAAHGKATGGTIISDTSWAGYEDIPRRIMAGYTRVFEEAAAQWHAPPDVVLVQGGVGGLVCAAASWFAWRFGAARPFLIACEPEHAACLLASAEAGRPVHIDASLDTIMAGLRCAEPSPLAWPAIAAGIDAFVAVRDAAVEDALRQLASAASHERIEAGPSGACGAAALAAMVSDPPYRDIREAARMDRSTHAMVIVTEGA